MNAQEQSNGHDQERVDERAGAPASGELDALLLELRANAGGLWQSLKRALYVEWQRLYLRALDNYFRAAFFLCLLGFSLAASISAALLVVDGVRGAFATFTGEPWVGSLGAGLVVLALTFGVCLGVRAHVRRDVVKETERKLALTARLPTARTP
ncbi:MAG: hypothetical protein K8S98_06280 [Planctomycetes bacterium]|nr:hypothetical protein [Planctomycetota bacterium]